MNRYTPLLAIAVITSLLGVWAGRHTFDDRPYLGFELLGTGNIHSVDARGPGATAGLKQGDLIVAVDGRPLYGRISLLGDREAGETITVTRAREGAKADAPLVLSAVTRQAYVFDVEKLIVGLIFFFTGTTILMLRPANLAIRLFFLFSQVLAGLCFGEILDPVVSGMIPATDLGRFLLAPLVLHFFLTFPRPVSDPVRTHLLRLVYGSAGVLTALYLYAVSIGADLYPYELWLLPRRYEVVVLLISLGALFRPYRKASLNAQRARRLLIAGMLLGFTPIFVTLLSMGGGPIIPYEWSLPALALVPLAFSYTVYQNELRTADLLLNRSMVYFLLTVLLLSVYALVFVTLNQILPSDDRIVHALAGALLVITGSILFMPLQRRIQVWIDRLFYGGWYDYRSLVQSVSAQIGRSVDLETLLGQLQEAGRTMRFQAGAILWLTGSHFIPRGSYGYERSMLSQLRLPSTGSLARALHREGRPLSRSELGRFVAPDLTEKEREVLANPIFEYWIPLLSRKTMRSFLVLGPRLAGEALDKEDLAILSTMSTQAASACENIALLESLRDQLAEVEQVRDELAEAHARLTDGREEERLHLARELHDGPVQDLYAMLHEIEAVGRASTKNRDHLSDLRDRTEKVAAMLRDICVELRPPLLADVGLDVAIRAIATRTQEKHPEIRIDVEIVPHSEELSEKVQLALFRVCQEALNNAVHHSGARTIRIRLEVDAEAVIVHVQDDGRGFVVPDRWIALARKGHLGLLGISERAESIGGELDVRSAPGEGTVVRVRVPTESEYHSIPINTDHAAYPSLAR